VSVLHHRSSGCSASIIAYPSLRFVPAASVPASFCFAALISTCFLGAVVYSGRSFFETPVPVPAASMWEDMNGFGVFVQRSVFERRLPADGWVGHGFLRRRRGVALHVSRWHRLWWNCVRTSITYKQRRCRLRCAVNNVAQPYAAMADQRGGSLLFRVAGE
jgi:hypothetical protein